MGSWNPKTQYKGLIIFKFKKYSSSGLAPKEKLIGNEELTLRIYIRVALPKSKCAVCRSEYQTQVKNLRVRPLRMSQRCLTQIIT
jgi:hypothetical protein